jgi:glyoxylase-like metal-dependent hydrolase (beta-lactamase superfamily II)
MEKVNPFPVIYHLDEMLEGYEMLKRLADSPDHIVPGHDPLVMERYPTPSPELEGIVIRLDE